MEINHTTEDLNFLPDHYGNSERIFKLPEMFLFKLIKNKNGFFTKYKPIEQIEAIKEKENIIAVSKFHSNEKNTKTNIIRCIKIINKKTFLLILLPNGMVIDTRKIKTKENEQVIVAPYSSSMMFYIKNEKKKNKVTRIIEIQLD